MTGRHVPSLPGTLHASHWPVHAAEQHTPSTQMLDEHSPAVLQCAPGFFFATHAPAAQYELALQSPSEVHEFGPPAHTVPVHVEPVGHGC